MGAKRFSCLAILKGLNYLQKLSKNHNKEPMKKLFTILFLVPIFLQAQTLETILQQHTEAMGGKTNWENLTSHIIVEKGSGLNGDFTLTRTMKMPDKYRIDFAAPDKKRVKGYDGKTGWIILNGEEQPMSTGEIKEMAEEVEFYGELILAQDRGHHVEFLGKEDLNGQKVYKLKLTKSKTDEQFYYINAATFLLEMTSEYSEDKTFEGTEFKTTFSDYRDVEGLLFPYEVTLFGNDKKLATYSVQSLKTNINVPDQIFGRAELIIRQNIKDFSAALMRQDYDAVTNAYTTDAKIFPINARILEGSDKIRGYWTPEEGSKNKVLYHKISPEEIKILGDEAYDYGYYEGRSTDVIGNEKPWKGKYVIVWKEVKPDMWKMYLDIWNQMR